MLKFIEIQAYKEQSCVKERKKKERGRGGREGGKRKKEKTKNKA
jgi:hypothetical protein